MGPIVEPNTSKVEYVYRIMPLRYFLTMLKRGKLYLPLVSKWDDPYELFLFKQKFIGSNGDFIDMMAHTYRIFGQCWTASRDSDAMWRIYSPDRMSVRIKTTTQNIAKLIETHQSNGLHVLSDWVEYKSQRDLTNYVKNLTFQSIFKDNILEKSLFIKRSSFDYEKEYRIVAWLESFNEQNNFSQSYLEIPFDMDFIQEVYLDPRLSEEEVLLLKDALNLRIGGACKVSQSTLQKFKQQTISYC